MRLHFHHFLGLALACVLISASSCDKPDDDFSPGVLGAAAGER